MSLPVGASICRLTPTDLVEFRAVLRVYSQAFDEPEEYEARQPDDDYVRSLLAKPDFIQLAASCDHQIVGALSAYILPKFEQARSEVYIYDLAVSEAYRRRGIAESLIQYVGSIAEDAGAHVVYVQADKGDEAPIALYGKLGEPQPVLHFDLTNL